MVWAHFGLSSRGVKWVCLASIVFSCDTHWHSAAAEFSEGAVDLAVEHGLVADDFEEPVAFGKERGRSAFFGVCMFTALGGVELRAKAGHFFTECADYLRQLGLYSVFKGLGIEIAQGEAVGPGEVVYLLFTLLGFLGAEPVGRLFEELA